MTPASATRRQSARSCLLVMLMLSVSLVIDVDVSMANGAAEYRFVVTITDCLQRARRLLDRLAKIGTVPLTFTGEMRHQDVLASLEEHVEEQAQVAVADELRQLHE